MVKTSYTRLKGSNNFRLHLLLATLSGTPIIIEDIRNNDTWPGLQAHEISFIRLIEKVCDDCTIEISETGTKLKYKPGVVIGGKNLGMAGVSRAIGYFMEPLVVLGLSGKNPPLIRLKVTCVDEGMVKSIRGVSFTTKLSPHYESNMIYAARRIFNRLLPDVHVFSYHRSGRLAGRSPGYGISLVAGTTTGCLISTDIAVNPTANSPTYKR